jgi:hypothetical protein
VLHSIYRLSSFPIQGGFYWISFIDSSMHKYHATCFVPYSERAVIWARNHGGELLKNQCQKCEPRSMMSMNIIVHVAMIQCPTTVAGVWSSTTRSTTVRWHTSAARAVVQRPATTSPTYRWSSCVTS